MNRLSARDVKKKIQKRDYFHLRCYMYITEYINMYKIKILNRKCNKFDFIFFMSPSVKFNRDINFDFLL